MVANPAIVGAETPYEGFLFGNLIERALNREGMTNESYSGTDSNLPGATAGQLARMKEIAKYVLTQLQLRFANIWGVSEATVDAVTDFQSVAVPTDFGRLVKDGLTINGVALRIISQEEFNRTRRPDADGGGTYITGSSGTPTVARFAVASPAAVTTRRVLCVFVYPVQTAAFTARFVYRATAKNLTNDTDSVRLPAQLFEVYLDMCSAAWAKQNRNLSGAAAMKAFVNEQASELENTPPTEDTPPCLRQGFPPSGEVEPLDL